MGIVKIAIIGASYLQEPLIKKAQERGYETHVFAWQVGDVGEKIADYFYPISIIEKEQILAKCQEIGINGICSIASDLATITVNYVAEKMNLIGNGMECTKISTNKHLMRCAFEQHNDPSPRSICVSNLEEVDSIQLNYPLIVKPVDRSGSRGVTKVEEKDNLREAVIRAMEQGFEKNAVIEEFAQGKEYSVECISWEGVHTLLAITKKYTTGAPNFVETAHLEPAELTEELENRIKSVVTKALDSLKITYGASHSELKIAKDGTIQIIEIGGRMGGDNIGADLVELSTGFDFVGGVLDVALGRKPLIDVSDKAFAAIRFIFSKDDLEILEEIKECNPELIFREDVKDILDEVVDESSKRFGYFIITSDNIEAIKKYMPKDKKEYL